MWSDELHKKMEEAENNSDSSNHEKAWEKMELLLDEHLPVKKKRRRFIFSFISATAWWWHCFILFAKEGE